MIKRYDFFTPDHESYADCDALETKDGGWCEYYDVKILEAETIKLQAERDKFKKALEYYESQEHIADNDEGDIARTALKGIDK
ncbi:hypothetical protein LCGC14_1862950 [marine sediment metagenome]|uniref:Uncharacterized protein n=1 Tax=marine sediment metagenome TaxID=412755 RepID=A0A0F9G7C4_9ZZZZ